MYGLQNSELSTCLFQFSHKTRQTMLLYAYYTPKVDFKRKFNHQQSFLYEWWLIARTIRKFRIENFESDHQYESNLESDVRFEIESNHEASQVPSSGLATLPSVGRKTLLTHSFATWLDGSVLGRWLPGCSVGSYCKVAGASLSHWSNVGRWPKRAGCSSVVQSFTKSNSSDPLLVMKYFTM